jgi:hypothetical protein
VVALATGAVQPESAIEAPSGRLSQDVSGQRGGGLLVGRRQHLGVGVQREPDRGVAKPLRDLL